MKTYSIFTEVVCKHHDVCPIDNVHTSTLRQDVMVDPVTQSLTPDKLFCIIFEWNGVSVEVDGSVRAIAQRGYKEGHTIQYAVRFSESFYAKFSFDYTVKEGETTVSIYFGRHDLHEDRTTAKLDNVKYIVGPLHARALRP